MTRLFDFFLSNRWLILIGMVLLLAAGIFAMLSLPVEAFPDLTNNQVVVFRTGSRHVAGGSRATRHLSH